MAQKDKIKELLISGPKTQGQLSMGIYGDNKHMPNIYISLMNLVKDGILVRSGNHPAIYSLVTNSIDNNVLVSKNKIIENDIKLNVKITNELLETAHKTVKSTNNYGREDDLITECFRRFPDNTNRAIVAMKVGLIDITNSTNISRYKRLISVVELVDCILNIKNIDERIKNGDPEVVNEIARSNGKINLFSFASKYYCYHNKNLYGKDDYSI